MLQSWNMDKKLFDLYVSLLESHEEDFVLGK